MQRLREIICALIHGHDWVLPNPHRSQDISVNRYQCSRCGKITLKVE